MGVSFMYGIQDGRLECGLSIGATLVRHSVGGWHDGLCELVTAVGTILEGATEANAAFQEEPGNSDGASRACP
jgi:hypothetical protein